MNSESPKENYQNLFTIDSYPVTTGSINPDYYRLSAYLGNNDEDLEVIENVLWEVIFARAGQVKPRDEHKDYEFIANGWEFSVFYDKENQKVIKIPAGIFPEVDSNEYFNNVAHVYRLLRSILGERFVLDSSIDVDGHFIIQNFITGKDNNIIGYNTQNKFLLEELINFTDGLIFFMERNDWLPDVNIQRIVGGFRIDNVIISDNRPIIYDFSSYYDVFRLYPKRRELELNWKGNALRDFNSWLKLKYESS